MYKSDKRGGILVVLRHRLYVDFTGILWYNVYENFARRLSFYIYIMNKNWRNRPTTIDYVSKDITWVVAIDESGTPDLRQVKKAIKEERDLNDGDKQFTVTACAIKVEDFPFVQDMVMAIKNKYWENALYNYKGEDKRICFHSKEIRGKKGAFNPSKIEYPSFIEDLSNLMGQIPMRLFSANIDKWKHVKKYRYPDDPYDLCLEFIFERLMFDFGGNDTCYIILESRGKKEDKELLDKIKALIDYGNGLNNASKFSRIKGVYFNPKWCQAEHDQKSYWELELADLCAYPIHKYLSYGHKDAAFDVLETKICGYPRILGRGLKSFP